MAQSQVFYGRENSPTAQNSDVNLLTGQDSTDILSFYFISDGDDAEGTSTDPSLVEDDSGNLLLELDGGVEGTTDPDTQIVINNVAYEFIVVAYGPLPDIGKVPSAYDGFGEDPTYVMKIEVIGYPTSASSGGNLVLVFTPDGSMTTEDWFPPAGEEQWGTGNIGIGDAASVYVCFCRGAMIETTSGSVPVENLGEGDEVISLLGRSTSIRWVGSACFSSEQLVSSSNNRPVCIPSGALGNGSPTSDLWVSPQHRILVQGHLAETLLGVPKVLVAAKHLDFGDLAKGKKRPAEVEYFHILLDKHDVLIANGAPAESLFLGDQAQTMLSDESLAEIEARFPREQHPEMWTGEVAAPTLTAAEAAVLSQALRADLQNAKNQAAAA